MTTETTKPKKKNAKKMVDEKIRVLALIRTSGATGRQWRTAHG